MLRKCRSPWHWRTRPAARRASSKTAEDRIEDAGALFGEPRRVAVHDAQHAGPPATVRPRLRLTVQGGDREGERGHQVEIEPPPGGEAIEQRLLVEACHLHDPVHRRAHASERQRAIPLARDRHDAAIECRRRAPVDAHLGLAHRLTPLRRRKIQVVVAHGALELPRARPGQEDHRGVRLDSLDGGPRMRRGRPEER
jgi:hypothetical protein